MSVAEEKMEAAIASNEELNKEIEESEDDGKIELPDEQEPVKEGEEARAADPPKKDDTDDKDDPDEGFTLDQEEEAEEPVGAAAAGGAKLTPEQQYLVDNITPLTLQVRTGDKVKEFTVFSPEQLPDDFEYLNAKQRETYSLAFGRMERKAEQLQGDYKNLQNVEQGKKYEELENRAIREDIQSLQKSGDLAKFKVKTDDPKFSDDPAAKQIQEVVDFMTERNDSYLKSYNGGGAYRHLGFAEAFALKTAQDAKKVTDPEDKARHEVGKRLGGAGNGASAAEKIIPRRGMSTEQILQKYGA